MPTKKTKSKKSSKATSTMKQAAKAWNASSKRGKYTDFVKKFFKSKK